MECLLFLALYAITFKNLPSKKNPISASNSSNGFISCVVSIESKLLPWKSTYMENVVLWCSFVLKKILFFIILRDICLIFRRHTNLHTTIWNRQIIPKSLNYDNYLLHAWLLEISKVINILSAKYVKPV